MAIPRSSTCLLHLSFKTLKRARKLQTYLLDMNLCRVDGLIEGHEIGEFVNESQ